MVKKVFLAVYEKSCHRAKTARILKLLKEVGLIKKTGNYLAGTRGNCYVISEIYDCFESNLSMDDWINSMTMDEFLQSLGLDKLN
jgi:hypothetical protein